MICIRVVNDPNQSQRSAGNKGICMEAAMGGGSTAPPRASGREASQWELPCYATSFAQKQA